MGGFSIWHWLIVLAVVLLLFGTGRVSTLMGDLAKGVKAFKKGLAEDDEGEKKPAAEQPKVLTSEQAQKVQAEKDEALKH